MTPGEKDSVHMSERGPNGSLNMEVTQNSSEEGLPPTERIDTHMKRFERRFVEYHLEARGIQRVEENERIQLTWISYLQVFLLWVSINLTANNITLGMLGPAVYGLNFTDSSLCSVFGAAVGSLATAWMATWGPISGNRTLVVGRYAMGWWPSKLVVLLNILQMLGYCLINCVVGGQILSAVSPNSGMSVAVGIVIIAIISWIVATFGIEIFHYYERFAFLPQLVIICILFGVSATNYDLDVSSQGDQRTIAGNRLSFFSICLSSAITYAPLAADFFVYYPVLTPKSACFVLTFLGLVLSFTMAFVVGVGLATGIYTYAEYSAAWSNGAGALIVEAFGPLGTFGKFCSVVIALGLVSNCIPASYSSGIDFQILGRYAERIPRIVWNAFGVLIYTVCALAGRAHLSEIFTNFLALMGYWVAIWMAILLEEQYFFRRKSGYNWAVWNDQKMLPVGVAALIAFLVAWAGAILCMAQVWYVGPLAGLVGAYGADMGNYVGFSWAALVYPPLRYIERCRLGR